MFHAHELMESAAGNWFADVLLHAYDEALCMQGLGGADAVLICAGSLRGDSVYGRGIRFLTGCMIWILISCRDHDTWGHSRNLTI
jgi:hypothetical protein